MTVLYSNDFEASASGFQAEWVLIAGGAVQVSTAISPALPARGAKAIGTNSQGNSSYWNGTPSLTGTGMRSAQKLNPGLNAHFGHTHRTNISTADNNIQFSVAYSAGFLRAQIDARANGGAGQSVGTYSLPVVAGDVLHMESTSIEIGRAHV